MFAEDFEIEALELLQQCDMDLMAAQKKAAELPQRQALAAIAEKKKAVREKYAQVSKMADALSDQIKRKGDEERLISKKIDLVQGKIDDATGNFRQIESLTKDLDGLRKRLDAVESEHLELEEKAAEADKVIDQIDAALKQLAIQEADCKKSFESDASQIAEQAKALTLRKKQAAAKLPRQLLATYLDVQKSCGGVAVARFEGNHCSRCRADLDGRISSIRKQAPLATCPVCKRLLIVE